MHVDALLMTERHEASLTMKLLARCFMQNMQKIA